MCHYGQETVDWTLQACSYYLSLLYGITILSLVAQETRSSSKTSPRLLIFSMDRLAVEPLLPVNRDLIRLYRLLGLYLATLRHYCPRVLAVHGASSLDPNLCDVNVSDGWINVVSSERRPRRYCT